MAVQVPEIPLVPAEIQDMVFWLSPKIQTSHSDCGYKQEHFNCNKGPC